jgi:hypothetical protein
MNPLVDQDQSETANATVWKRKRVSDDVDPTVLVVEPNQQSATDPLKPAPPIANKPQTSNQTNATAVAPQSDLTRPPVGNLKNPRGRKRRRKSARHESIDSDDEPTSPVAEPYQACSARGPLGITPMKVPPVIEQGQDLRASDDLVNEEFDGFVADQSDEEALPRTPNFWTISQSADDDAAAMLVSPHSDRQDSVQGPLDSWIHLDPFHSPSTPTPLTFSQLNTEDSEHNIHLKDLSVPPDILGGWRAPSIFGGAGKNPAIPIDVDALDVGL